MTTIKRFAVVLVAVLAVSCGEEPTGSVDQLPPFITWLSPKSDTLFTTDTITVEFAAADDGGVVSRVEVYVNNALGATITAEPFRAVLDFSALPGDSAYDVYAFAYDPTGKSRKTQDTHRFTKRVSPLIDWLIPTADTTVDSDTTTIEFDVIDPRGTLDSVNIYVAGTLHQSVTSPPFSTAVLDLSAFGNNRSQEIYATAVDTSGAVKSTTDILTFHKELPPATATWTLLAPATSPAGRYEHSFSLDAANQRAVLFGGVAEPVYLNVNDAWSFDLNTNAWDSIEATGTLPDNRKHHGAGIISGNRLLIFGGEGGSGVADTLLQDCDTLNLSTFAWGPMGSFPGATAGMAVAVLDYEVYSYGGAIDSDDNGFYEPADRIFRFDGTDWNDITLLSSRYPGSRYFAAMAADAEGSQIFVYGGAPAGTNPGDSSNFRMDVGTLQWQSTLAPGPSPVYETAVVYDSLNNRILMWGGALNGGGYLPDLWQFSLGRNTWRKVPTVGGPPAGRRAHQMVIDAPNQRIIMFGGDVLNVASGETWELAW